MKKCFLIVAMILSGHINIVLAHTSLRERATTCPLSTGANDQGSLRMPSVINANDTVVFDLSHVVCTGTYAQIPVSILSDDLVYAMDFSLKFDESKMTYDSLINNKAYLNASANYNPTDSTLRFSSFSFQPIENNSALVSLRFNLLSGQITASDLNTIHVYLNGDLCSSKVIDAPPPVIITASGSTSFVAGDSILLTSVTGSGYLYSWSTGSTSQSIVVKDSGAYSVTATDMMGCSTTFTILVTLVSPLPVKLAYFSISKANQGILIDWTTASEINNDYFTVERSEDIKNWEEIARVKGAGNSTLPLNYSVPDLNPLDGLNYYRLRQTDYDGTVRYSEIEVINFEFQKINNVSLTVYPNPVSDRVIHVELTCVDDRQMCTLKITDLSGTEKYMRSIEPKRFLNGRLAMQIRLDNDLPSGMYEVIYSGDTFHKVMKIVLK